MNDILSTLDSLSELVYVSDTETYELLYVNASGREALRIDSLSGRLCYEVLQNKEAPCSFCTNSRIMSGEVCSWEYTNPVLNKHFFLKDQLVEWNGKAARLEIAFDITETQTERHALKAALDAENMMMDCAKELYAGGQLDQAINCTLKKMGEFLNAERAYIFSIRNYKMYNTYEWCAEGIEPQIDNLQELPVELISFWKPHFDNKKLYMIDDMNKISEERPEEFRILSEQGIRSLIAAPMEENGNLIGYIGLDNPPAEKVRNIAAILQTIRYFIMLAIQRDQDEKLLTRLSYHDSLTGVFNRTRFTEDCSSLAERKEAAGILYLDINGLKDANDRFGHDAGDQMILDCARRITMIFGPDMLYRIGGDEFVLIYPGVTGEHFGELVERLRAEFEADPICKAAIGSCWTESSEDLKKAITTADTAMYEDKRKYYQSEPASGRYRHTMDHVWEE